MKSIRSHFMLILLLLCPYLLQAAVYTVDNTLDNNPGGLYVAGDGTNSLRRCIELANVSAGMDTIKFNLAATPATITTTGVIINDLVYIDGYSQTGASANNLLIEVNGTGNIFFINGINSSGSTIRGLVINGGDRAIFIISSNNNTIKGNYLGTDITGTSAAAVKTAWNLIQIENSMNNVIGGTGGVIDRNIISGANERGIFLIFSTGTTIINNYIGTDTSGTLAIPNALTGIMVLPGCTNTTIGGNTANHRNIISGNNGLGLFFNESTDCVVQNNYIGVDKTGIVALPNNGRGIEAVNISDNLQMINNVIAGNTGAGIAINNSSYPVMNTNKIGVGSDGSTVLSNQGHGIELNTCFQPTIGDGAAGSGNIISNNQLAGVWMMGSDSAIVKGNIIGSDITGIIDLGNIENGIWMANCHNAIIGGASVNERNLLSGNNQRGAYIEFCQNLILQGNYIGVTLTGNTALSNASTGVEININSDNASILDNVIASNNGPGVMLLNSNYSQINGNKIGLGADGTTSLPNTGFGVQVVNCLKPQLGNGTIAGRNYISNNTFSGAFFVNSDSLSVRGNYIGVDITGMLDRGNNESGIFIDGCLNPVIGGPGANDGNILSGNQQRGISISGNRSDRAIIKGNIIGLGSDKSTIIANEQLGVFLFETEQSQLGGLTVNERNIISGNNGNGVELVFSPNSVIEGNYVGVDGTGMLNRGNFSNGIMVVESADVRVGGGSAAARNIVGGSQTGSGIIFTGASPNGIIKGNFVGIGKDGITPIGNQFSGIYILSTADNAIVGGSDFMERNVCSGNGVGGTGDGIRVEGANGITFLGNFCGVDSTGTIGVPNSWGGISMNESSDNIVGGSGAFEGNICSGNLNEGIYLRNAHRNQIFGNFVGTDKTGTLQLGNDDFGINISAAGPNTDNIVGGSPANANIIAFTNLFPGPGVLVDANSHRNLITYNKIFCNAGLGIDITGAGNEGVVAPVITNSDANSISGTGTAGHTIHLYMNSTVSAGTQCDCEGETFIATVPVAGDGTWTYLHNLGLTSTEASSISATQTNGTNSTSEFSACPGPLPVTFIYVEAKKTEDGNVLVSWATAMEKENVYFVIERSVDGKNFEAVGKVDGAINSSTTRYYQFTDYPEYSEIVYYRIKQIDINGNYSYSQIRPVNLFEPEIKVIQAGSINIAVMTNFIEEEEVTIELLSSNGQMLSKEAYQAKAGQFEKIINTGYLANGIYLVRIKTNSNFYVKKIQIHEAGN